MIQRKKQNRTYQQGDFSQLTLLCTPTDGDDVTFAGGKLGLWTDVTIFLWWCILTCDVTIDKRLKTNHNNHSLL